MLDQLLQTDLEELKLGYRLDTQKGAYCCLLCPKTLPLGEVYPIGGKFYEAGKAAQLHVRHDHGDMMEILASYDKKFTGLTANQNELLTLFASGLADGEIAKRMGVAPSTIRHQRFMLRERAKQAKLYLAIWELTEEGSRSAGSKRASDELLDIPSGATLMDDRFVITRAEEEKILRIVFSSLDPLRLKAFPPKEKRKIVILRKIAAQFQPGRRYSEKEVNQTLAPIHEDFATLRRYLIEYGFMERTTDCKEYWII